MTPTDLGFTEEHGMLRAAARRLFSERSPSSEVRRLAADEAGFDRSLYQELATLGWLALGLPEEHGGPGLGLLGLSLVLEEAGRAALPSPFFSASLSALALGGCDEQVRSRWLSPLLSGERVATLSLADAPALSAARRGGGYVLSGTLPHVFFGHAAGLLLAPALLDGEPVAAVVDLTSDGVTIEKEHSLDLTRPSARVTLRDAPASGEQVSHTDVFPAVRSKAMAVLSAEMAGGADAVLRKTVDYALERRQFDRPIGAFQAVKFPLVDAMIAVEQSLSLALSSASAFDAKDPGAPRLARMAKARTSDAFSFVTGRGVQLHGGFGFTWDCDVHLYLRRSMVSRSLLGDSIQQRRALAEELFG